MDSGRQGSWCPIFLSSAKLDPTERSQLPVPSSMGEASGTNGLESVGVSAGIDTMSTSSGPENQLQNVRISRSAATLASIGQAHCHDLEQRPQAVRDPMRRWAHTMPYGNLLSSADSTSGSGMSSLTQLMLAQMRGSQVISGATNQLLLGSNHHLCQMSQYGFPIPVLPIVNSLPDKVLSTSVSEAVCSPSTPFKLSESKRKHGRLPALASSTGMSEAMCSSSTPCKLSESTIMHDIPPPAVIDLVDENMSGGAIQGKNIGMLRSAIREPVEFSSSDFGLSPQVVSSKQRKCENNIAMTFEAASIEHPKINDTIIGNDGIDLNKTPQQKQKPRRKKHRPKVVREGKPSTLQNPVTPKTVTPKAQKEQSSSGKRKYMRKKKDINASDVSTGPLGDIVEPQSESGSKLVKRKYTRKKKVPTASDVSTGQLGDIVDPQSESRSKSVKRCLNFDSEEAQATVGQLSPQSIFACNEAQVQNEWVSGTITSSSVKSDRISAQGQEVALENSLTGITSALNNEAQAQNAGVSSTITSSSFKSALTSAQGQEVALENSLTGTKSAFNNEAQAQNACISGTITSSSVKSTMTSDQGQEEALENSPTGTASALNSLTNQLPRDYIRIPETPTAPYQPSRRKSMEINHKLRGNKRAARNPPSPPTPSPSPSPQPSRRELIQDNLKDFSRKNDLSDRLMESHQKNQFHSDNTSDVPLRGIKRICNLVGEYCISGYTNFMCANNGMDCISETNGSSYVPYFPKIHKKKRTEKGPKLTSNSSFPVSLMASSSWETRLVVQSMLSLDQQETMTKNTSKVQAQHRNLISSRVSYDKKSLSTSLKPSGFYDTECNLLSTPEKGPGYNNNQQTSICVPRDNYANSKTKKRSRKEQIPLVKSVRYVRVTEATSENSIDKNLHLQVSSLQDCQISRNAKEPLCGISHSTLRVPYEDPVDDIVWKIKRLNISGNHENFTAETQNALVAYNSGGGMVVPYQGQFDLTKKRRPRPKVDLDPESNRVWKVLMGKESAGEGVDIDKEKWWDEERGIFRGRVDSFIARMHLVQGDRRFSRWKGSVVDSVVGVFLTQNVSDHLSSSAFMALAARFPCKSKINENRFSVETLSTYEAHQSACSVGSTDNIKCQEKMLGQEFCYQGFLVNSEAEHVTEKEMVNNNESCGSNTREIVLDYAKGKGLEFHVRELEIGHQSPDSRTSTPVTVTGSTSAAETEDRLIEDVVSCQNYVLSSQNSSEYQVQMADQVKFGPDVEDMLYGDMCNALNSAASFTQLLQMAESTSFKEVYSHSNGRVPSIEYSGTINQMACLEVNKKTSATVQLDDFKGECPSMSRLNSNSHDLHHEFMDGSCTPSMSYDFHDSRIPPTASGMPTKNTDVMGISCGPSSEILSEDMIHETLLFTSRTEPTRAYAPLSKNSVQRSTCLGNGVCSDKYTHHNSSLSNEKNEASSCQNTPRESSHLQDDQTVKFQLKESGVEFQVESRVDAIRAQTQECNGRVHQTCLDMHNNSRETLEVVEALESTLKDEVYISQKVPAATENHASKSKAKAETEKKKYDWDKLRKQACQSGTKMERSSDMMDSLDWEAVRCADVNEISESIRERGMNNVLSARIKDFLNRLVEDHGSVDLEWLRDVPPASAKDYLLSIRGLGLKSVECVRLLTLHHLAFPVDTNVGRICVRLGWVPLQPLPESLQLHLLEMYPVLETIQKYLWPRLCKLDQRTLYELHYQMITFGKVFCTKSKPNCNACPMRAECKHFASAFASARLALPGLEEKGLESATIPSAFETVNSPVYNQTALPQLEVNTLSREGTVSNNCQPIIEEPSTPEPEISRSDIEDDFCEDPDEIPHIKLNFEALTQNIQDYMQANNLELQDGDMSNALVVLTREAASIPVPKLKNASRLRTEHQVYELPDSHPLLEGLDQREPDDPSPYLLAIWSPGETAQSTEPPKMCCNSHGTNELCDEITCFYCNGKREARSQTVRGTLLIPCRTAMRGSFPLNGTYFQVNEVFADHHSSLTPIVVPRKWLWHLPTRTVYFGTSVPTIFKGLTTEGIQFCFWKGFVCVRGFDRTTRAPKPLYARLHFPASKIIRKKKAEAEVAAAADAARKEG